MGSFVCTHAAGRDADVMRALPPLRVGEGVVGRAVAEARPIWTADILNDPGDRFCRRSEYSRRLDTLPFRSVMAAPLLVNGVPRGALVCHNRAPDSFSEEQAELLAALASLAGVALENARLHEQTRAQAHRAQVVSDIARIVSSALDLPDLLRAAAPRDPAGRSVLRWAASPTTIRSTHTISFHEMRAEGGQPERPILTRPGRATRCRWQVMQTRQDGRDRRQSREHDPVARRSAWPRGCSRRSACRSSARTSACAR